MHALWAPRGGAGELTGRRARCAGRLDSLSGFVKPLGRPAGRVRLVVARATAGTIGLRGGGGRHRGRPPRPRQAI